VVIRKKTNDAKRRNADRCLLRILSGARHGWRQGFLANHVMRKGSKSSGGNFKWRWAGWRLQSAILIAVLLIGGKPSIVRRRQVQEQDNCSLRRQNPAQCADQGW